MCRKNWTDEKIFSRLLNNKTDKTYWDNINELRSRQSRNIFNTCTKLVKSSKVKERIIGIDILDQLGLPPLLYHYHSSAFGVTYPPLLLIPLSTA